MSWIEITSAAPVLNTPNFSYVFGGDSGTSIPLDAFGHPQHFEFVALKKMRFKVVEEIGSYILQIQWPTYGNQPLYIDRRFCSPISRDSFPAPKKLSVHSILQHMETRVGTPYVWGGNWALGIPEMLLYYPPKKPLDSRMQTLWTFQGLDCSGLLFEATQGLTPRNTSHLLHVGRSLKTQEPLQPLDMIIYPGHVLFVRNETTIIESKSPFGVRICPLTQRMEEISAQRTLILDVNCTKLCNPFFTIRRLNLSFFS